MKQDDLERDIFGDGSELSEEEDDIPRQRTQLIHHDVEPDDDNEDSAESSDAYVQDIDRPRLSAPRKATKKRSDDDRANQARRDRKRRPAPVTEEDLNDMPPEKANKLRLDMQFDAILKPKKASRFKKRKKDADEDVLDRFADEEVSRLREAMLATAADDDKANREKLPATHKLRLLPEVMDVLRKSSLAQSIIDNNLLEGVRRWLEPLPDRSLPALNIQRDFFPLLRRMEFIDAAALRESGLGRVVLFYTKCQRVTPDVRRAAAALVDAWSRPIIKRSASYRDRVVPVYDGRAMDSSGAIMGSGIASSIQPPRAERLNAILARAKEGEKNRIRHTGVMIPQRELGNYTVAPRADAGVLRHSANLSVEHDIERRRKNAERLRSLTRKVGIR